MQSKQSIKRCHVMMSGITSLSPRDPGRSHCRMEGGGGGGGGRVNWNYTLLVPFFFWLYPALSIHRTAARAAGLIAFQSEDGERPN